MTVLDSFVNECPMGLITHGPLSNPYLQKVAEVYGVQAFRRTSICMEFERFLQRIKAGGKRCLEIGSYNGLSAVVLSQYFQEVIAVSVDVQPEALIKHQIVETLGIKNIRFIDVFDNQSKAEVVRELSYNFAYLDGDHTNNTETDFELTKDCGRILFHEYWPLQPAVWNLVNSLPADEVVVAEVDCFAYWERKYRG